jgi:hypothetical protein
MTSIEGDTASEMANTIHEKKKKNCRDHNNFLSVKSFPKQTYFWDKIIVTLRYLNYGIHII